MGKLKSIGFILFSFFLFSSSYAQWVQENVGSSNYINCVQYLNASEIFLGGDDGIIKTSNGGTSWTIHPIVDLLNFPITGSSFYSVHFFNSTDGVATGQISLGNSETILRTTNGGDNWDPVYVNNGGSWPRMLVDFAFPSSTLGFAVGYEGRGRKTTDAGQSWSSINMGVINDLEAVHFVNTLIGFAVGDGVILKTSDGGSNWSSTSVTDWLVDIAFVTPNIGYSISSSGSVYKTTNSGTNWNLISASVLPFTALFPLDEDTMFASTGGPVYKTTDGGLYWFLQPSSVGGSLYDIEFINNTDGIAVGEPGLVFMTSTSGNLVLRNDAGISSVITEQTITCAGIYDAIVTLDNFGADTLYSVDIVWEIDGIPQTTFNWVGALPPQANIDSLNIGTINMSQYTTNYVIESWTNLPNSAFDEDQTNDSSTVTKIINRLAGNYTIGGTTPDFATIVDAVNQLNSFGVCDSVIFDIRPGIYSGALTSYSYFGNSNINTVTFRSETGLNTNVIITDSVNTAGSYLWELRNTQYLRIKNVSFKVLNLNSGLALSLINGAGNNRFSGNIFDGIDTNSTSNNYAVIKANNAGNDNYFIDNTINFGSYGLRYYLGSPRNTGIVIRDNSFNNQYSFGLYIQDNDSLLVKGNTVFSNSSYNLFKGFSIVTCNLGINITKNIITTNLGYGLHLSGCNGFSEPLAPMITNNMVTNNSIGALYIQGCSYLKFYNNSLVNYSTGRCTMISGGDDNYFQNNIMANYGGGRALYSTNVSGDMISDYNNYYTTGPILIEYGGSNYGSLSSFSLLSGLDANSISIDPEFYNGDLHIQLKNSNYELNGAGGPLGAIVDDIDGDTRDTLFPDIGADEFTLPGLDAGISDILFGSQVCAGLTNIDVQVKNFGVNTVDTIAINWKVDGIIQTPVVYTNSIASSDTSAVISLGTINFISSNTYSLVAWTSMPNNLPDQSTRNDTDSMAVVVNGISGTYTIGGSSPDFLTITAAIDTLILSGICGAVVFNIRTGSYNEQLMIPYIEGVTPTNTITFQSETGNSNDVIMLTAGFPQIDFDSAAFVIFNSVYLSQANSDEQVYFTNKSNNITLLDCQINGRIASISSEESFIRIENCIIINGYEGIMLSGTSSQYQPGVIIKNNVIVNQAREAIELSYVSNAVIESNFITKISTSNYTSCLSINNAIGGLKVTSNSIMDIPYGGLMSINGSYSTPENPASVYNNILLSNGANGAFLSNVYNLEFVHNSIDIKSYTGPSSLTTALNLVQASDIKLLNNIFVQEANDYALYISSFTQNIQSDYNDIVSNGQYLAFDLNTMTYAETLNEWVAGSGHDANSFSVDPNFVSTSDLHINNNFYLDGSGLALNSVLFDIDTDARNPTNPDIGADEFDVTRIANDAGAWKFSDLNSECSGAPTNIFVSIRNFGDSVLTSATINWEINAVPQTTYFWTGFLATDSVSPLLLLGVDTFSAPVIYSIRAWTSDPNGVLDSNAVNDSAMVNSIKPVLDGTYTIGGTNPDYLDFTEAVDNLILLGICGPTVFNVRNGTYTERVIIPRIMGSDSVNTIVFQSESGDSSTVIMQRFVGANYLIKLDSTQYLTFQNLTLKTVTPGQSQTVIDIESGCSNIQFLNNRIEALAGTGGSGLVYSTNYFNCHNIWFKNNHLTNDFWGIRLLGDSSSTGLIIEGNIIQFSEDRAIELQDLNDIIIRSNQINSFSGSGNYGIRMLNCNGPITISKNDISASGKHAIYLWRTDGDSLLPINVNNNFLSSITQNTLYIYNGDYINIYSNNLRGMLAGTLWFSSVLYTHGGSNIKLLNNCIYNAANYTCVYFDPPSAIISSNYNNLHSNGSLIAKYQYTSFLFDEFPTIDSIINTTGNETNSISVDPLYLSSTDLHVLNKALDSAGTPIPGIIDDIDGDLRDTAFPDIGADEKAIFPQDDAGVATFDLPINLCQDSNDVYVKIRNYGSDTLLNIDIIVEINGSLQGTYLWTGSLAPGVTSPTINVGTFNFPQDSVYYFNVWTANPNGNFDFDLSNDTVTAGPLYPALNGTFTIGGSSPNYITFTDAVSALVTNGVCGPVTFNVRDGYYNEQIEIPQILGVNSNNYLAFQSESGDSSAVVLAYSSVSSADNYVIKLSGVDYLTLQQITFQSLDSNFSRVMEIGNTSRRCNFLNNQFIGMPTTLGTLDHANIHSYTSKDDFCNYLNNYVLNGSWGMFLGGSSSTPSSMEDGIVVNGNVFKNQWASALYFKFQKNITVNNNHFTSNSTSYGYDGIEFQIANRDIEVKGNNFPEVPGVAIWSNYVTTGVIANNFASVVVPIGPAVYERNALVVDNSSSIDVYNNTLVTDDTSATLWVGRSSTGSGFNIEVKNNIIVNTASAKCLEIYKIAGITNLYDHNDYYTDGSVYVRWAPNQSFIYTDYADIISWRDSTGNDSNSISVLPQFASSSDLHIIGTPPLDNAGIPLIGITDDIDGEIRDTANPDIGADEFNGSLKFDAGVVEVYLSSVCPGTQDILIRIANFDTTTLISATINLVINGDAQPTYFWTGSVIPSDTTAYINIGSYTFTDTTSYDLIAWSGLPNYAFDSVTVNDSSSLSISIYPPVFLGNDTIICKDDLLTLDGFQSYYTNYAWSTGDTTSSITVDSTATIVLVVTDLNACLVTDSINVVESINYIFASAGLDTSLCQGTTATLAASGGSSYIWDPDSTLSCTNCANPTAITSTTNTYVVSIVDSVGCISLDSVTVNIFPIMSTSLLITDASCFGYNDGDIDLTVTGGSPPFTYVWSTGDSIEDLAALVAGSYDVSITDTNSCEILATGIVSEPPQILLNLGADTGFCSGDSLIFDAGVGFAAYSWSTGATSSSIMVNIQGVYSVTVTDSTGCTASDTINIALFTILNVNTTAEICDGDSIFLQGAYRNSPGVYLDTVFMGSGCDSVTATTLIINSTYNVNAPSQAICDGDSVLIFGTYQKTTGTYYDTSTAVNGCDSIIAASLSVIPNYSITTPDENICIGDSVVIFGTYQKIAGIYYDSLITLSGCDSVISTTLIVNSLPTVSFSGLDTGYCINSAPASLTGIPSGGLFSGSGISSSQFDPTAAGTGTHTITYLFTDGNGCTDSESQIVNVTTCTGIENLGFINSFEIYPNPNTGDFMIEINITHRENLELKITNSLGQVIFTKGLNQFKGSFVKRVELDNYPVGIYNFQLITDKGVIIKQAIIE